MIFFFSTIRELFSPFFMTFGVMSVILIMQKFYALASLMLDRQFPPEYLLLMIFFLLPQVFSITIPLGVIGSVFVTVIRKSVDAEIITFRAAGKSLWEFALPYAVFGFMTALATSVITIWFMPLGFQHYSELQIRIVRSHAESTLIPGKFSGDFGGKVIQVGGRLPSGEFSEIFITDRVYRRGKPVITADRGRIEVDDESRQVYLRLENGVIYSPDAKGKVFRETGFEELDYMLSMKPTGTAEVNKIKQTPSLALWESINNAKKQDGNYRKEILEFFYRLTLPWGCFVFALAAIPMAIVDPRSGRSGSFLRAIFLVITYYIIWIGFKDMVQNGKAPAWVLWLPLALVLSFGLFRLWQVNSDTTLLRTLRIDWRKWIFNKQ